MSQEESANQADHPIHQPVDSGATASPHMGGRLAAAREQAGLSVEEVAGKLRLSPRQVEALEAGDAEALPGAMFVRGFMRNYARLLGIDPEPLLEAYQEATPAPARHEISLQSINIAISQRNVKSSVPYVLVALALLLALAVWALFMQNPVSTPPAVTPTPQENQTSSVSLILS